MIMSMHNEPPMMPPMSIVVYPVSSWAMAVEVAVALDVPDAIEMVEVAVAAVEKNDDEVDNDAAEDVRFSEAV